jgi:hypothetical protein
MEGILWLLSEMLSNARNVEILLNLFMYMISKLVPVGPALLLVGMSTLGGVQNRWMILPI